eukprot:2188867-Pyramimonas_sp.AAC.1
MASMWSSSKRQSSSRAARFSACRSLDSLFGRTHTPRCAFHLSSTCAGVLPTFSATATTAGWLRGGGPARSLPKPSEENWSPEPSGPYACMTTPRLLHASKRSSWRKCAPHSTWSTAGGVLDVCASASSFTV